MANDLEIPSNNNNNTNVHTPDVHIPSFEVLNVSSYSGKLRLFLFSGSTQEDLAQQISDFGKTVEKSSFEQIRAPEIDSTHKFRHAILASSKHSLVSLLSRSSSVPSSSYREIPQEKPKVCMLMTCQGSQYPSMGRKLFETSTVFATEFDKCATFVEKNFSGLSFRHLLFEDHFTSDMSEPSLFLSYTLALEYALFKLLQSWGVTPDYVMGMSFGDYAAALVSGIITMEDAFTLILHRCRLMKEKVQEEAFLALEASVDEYNEVLEKVKIKEEEDDKDINDEEKIWLDIACINSPKQTCLVGHKKHVLKVLEAFGKTGRKTMLNPCYLPYHSRLASPILEDFEKVTSDVVYGATPSDGIKFVWSIDGEIKDTIDKDHFVNHLKTTVNFVKATETLLKEGVTHFLEVGPHPLNIQFVKDVLQKNYNDNPSIQPDGQKEEYVLMSTLRKKLDDRVALLNTAGRLYMAGFNLDWNEIKELEN